MTSLSGSRTMGLGGVRAAIALLVTIPILVPLFAIVLIWFSERDAMLSAQDRVIAASRVVGANIRLTVETTLERLRSIDESLGRNPETFSLGEARANGGIIALYDADGVTLERSGARGASVADSPEFQALAAGKPWVITPLIGTPQSLRLFGVAHRLERNGEFAGALVAYIAADYLSDVWAKLNLGADSTVGMIRDDGWLITRYPVPAQAIDLSDYVLFTEHVPKAPSGVYAAPVSPVDGHPRMVGYEHLDDIGVVAVASMSRSAASDAFWSSVGSTALVAAPVFIALVLLCGWAILLLLRHERSRAELQIALARNRVLFQEIHHRVKNNLQAVSAMVRLQAAPQDMKDDLTRRIAAMTAIHQHMYEAERIGDVDASAYLGKLLSSLRDSAPPGVRLDWSLDAIQLSPEQALPLGLLVNEVVANAFKHGFPDGRTGQVKVVLERGLNAPEAVLTIADDGAGQSADGGAGLGSRLIAGFVAQLGGRSTTSHDGAFTFNLRFPLQG